MRVWPWIVGGGALAYAMTRSRDVVVRAPASLPGRWVWPIARWQGRGPIVSDGFGSPRLVASATEASI